MNEIVSLEERIKNSLPDKPVVDIAALEEYDDKPVIEIEKDLDILLASLETAEPILYVLEDTIERDKSILNGEVTKEQAIVSLEAYHVVAKLFNLDEEQISIEDDDLTTTVTLSLEAKNNIFKKAIDAIVRIIKKIIDTILGWFGYDKKKSKKIKDSNKKAKKSLRYLEKVEPQIQDIIENELMDSTELIKENMSKDQKEKILKKLKEQQKESKEQEQIGLLTYKLGLDIELELYAKLAPILVLYSDKITGSAANDILGVRYEKIYEDLKYTYDLIIDNDELRAGKIALHKPYCNSTLKINPEIKIEEPNKIITCTTPNGNISTLTYDIIDKEFILKIDTINQRVTNLPKFKDFYSSVKSSELIEVLHTVSDSNSKTKDKLEKLVTEIKKYVKKHKEDDDPHINTILKNIRIVLTMTTTVLKDMSNIEKVVINVNKNLIKMKED